MRPRTREALLWLAGLGGAAVLLRELAGLVDALLQGLFRPAQVLAVSLLLAAAIVALAAVRARLEPRHDEPVHFTEAPRP